MSGIETWVVYCERDRRQVRSYMYVDLLCVSLSSETERNKHYVIEVRELKEQIIVYEKQITKLEKEITVVEDRYYNFRTTPSMPRLGETPYLPMQAGPKGLRGV